MYFLKSILILTCLLATPAFAYDWEPVVKCDGDQLTIDRSFDYRFGKEQIHQIVLKGEALDYSKRSRAIPHYEIDPKKHEAVLRLSRNLKYPGYFYIQSMYMEPGTPATVAYYDIEQKENGLILRYNQPSSRNYAEYFFEDCTFLLNP